MALSCEIGMYLDFNVTDDGLPYGCPGLEVFDIDHFNISKYLFIIIRYSIQDIILRLVLHLELVPPS